MRPGLVFILIRYQHSLAFLPYIIATLDFVQKPANLISQLKG